MAQIMNLNYSSIRSSLPGRSKVEPLTSSWRKSQQSRPTSYTSYSLTNVLISKGDNLSFCDDWIVAFSGPASSLCAHFARFTLCIRCALYSYIINNPASNILSPNDISVWLFILQLFDIHMIQQNKALEPHISKQIMELHHSKHHQTYITGLNAAEESYGKATTTQQKIGLQAALKFNGGGESLLSLVQYPSNQLVG